MSKRFTWVLALAGALLLTGCATRTRMAFEDAGQRAEGKPILLMAATLKNNYRPDYQPKLNVLHVEKPGAKDAADRLNFVMDDEAKMETKSAATGNTYLLRMELPPGKYEIVGMTSMSGIFPVIGSFFTPMHAPIEVKENGVFYLGHVQATVRERQGNEFRAGAPIPLIDQAVVGASGGTFDVQFVDAQAADEALFRSRFPALHGVAVQKALLPPFDRAKAQKWWEAH